MQHNVVRQARTLKIKVTCQNHAKHFKSCGLRFVLFFELVERKRKRDEGGLSYPFVRVFCDAAVFEHNEGSL